MQPSQVTVRCEVIRSNPGPEVGRTHISAAFPERAAVTRHLGSFRSRLNDGRGTTLPGGGCGGVGADCGKISPFTISHVQLRASRFY